LGFSSVSNHPYFFALQSDLLPEFAPTASGQEFFLLPREVFSNDSLPLDGPVPAPFEVFH